MYDELNLIFKSILFQIYSLCRLWTVSKVKNISNNFIKFENSRKIVTRNSVMKLI